MLSGEILLFTWPHKIVSYIERLEDQITAPIKVKYEPNKEHIVNIPGNTGFIPLFE